MLDSAQAKGAIRKAVAAITGFMLVMVLLIALLVTGFYLLVQAAIMALSPIVGEVGAMAVVGFGCVLLLAVFFQRMMKAGSPPKRGEIKGSDAGPTVDELRELIRDYPLESALTAFAAGIVQQGDSRLKSLLLQGGMEFMKRTDTAPEAASSGQEPKSGPTPD